MDLHTLNDPDLKPFDDFLEGWRHTRPADRWTDLRRQAHRFRERMLKGPQVIYYRSFDLIRVPYPTKYALRDACKVPVPLVHILNRLYVVQFKSAAGATKTLLISPTDTLASRSAPYFRRMAKMLGSFEERAATVLAPQSATVESCLQSIGLKPDQVDYITFDHLHTQDVRKWFGSAQRPGYFPNAKLLIFRQEWESAHGLLPPQNYWYCPDGVAGIPPNRVVLLDRDTMVGDSIALVRTPGHTEGNHSIAVHTPDGLLVTSENGVSADCYAPKQSEIPGLKGYAYGTGMEVVINGNTMERGLDQYVSMLLEREIAGPNPRDGKFYNVYPSSELTAYFLFPGIKPTFTFGSLAFGAPVLA